MKTRFYNHLNKGFTEAVPSLREHLYSKGTFLSRDCLLGEGSTVLVCKPILTAIRSVYKLELAIEIPC